MRIEKFKPEGEGWIEDGIPSSVPRQNGRFEVVNYTEWEEGPDKRFSTSKTKSWHRFTPAPPVELPTERYTVINAQWPGDVSQVLMLGMDHTWISAQGVHNDPAKLAAGISGFTVLSRPIKEGQ